MMWSRVRHLRYQSNRFQRGSNGMRASKKRGTLVGHCCISITAELFDCDQGNKADDANQRNASTFQRARANTRIQRPRIVSSIRKQYPDVRRVLLREQRLHGLPVARLALTPTYTHFLQTYTLFDAEKLTCSLRVS